MDENGISIGEAKEYMKCIKFKDCISCPDNGICDLTGHLTCNMGYIKQNGKCVENILVRQSALAALTDIQQDLQNIRGTYECGNAIKESFWFPYSFIR
jgi:hypothetical protein